MESGTLLVAGLHGNLFYYGMGGMAWALAVSWHFRKPEQQPPKMAFFSFLLLVLVTPTRRFFLEALPLLLLRLYFLEDTFFLFSLNFF